MHDVDLVVDLLALLDQDGRFSVGSSADWEGGVPDRCSAVTWNNGVETKGYLKLVGEYGSGYCVLTLIHNMLKILHLFDLLKR